MMQMNYPKFPPLPSGTPEIRHIRAPYAIDEELDRQFAVKSNLASIQEAVLERRGYQHADSANRASF
jgi:hypothetical protein